MTSPPFRFTIFDLESCLIVARAVHDNGGLLSSAQLAEHLKYKSDNNGSFNTRLANTRLFGLVEGSSAALRPTARALAILAPDYPDTEARARLEAFEAVPLYAEVLAEYHGKPLPDEAGLRNALTTRWGVLPDKAPTVVSRLMESADQAGLFRIAGGRSKMLRPTFGSDGRTSELPAGSKRSGDERPGTDGGAELLGARANKLIDGALDMLPSAGSWDEAQLQQWIAFFESALRVVYKLPKGAAS